MTRTLVVGHRGVVGRAVVALWKHHEAAAALRADRELVLVDAAAGPAQMLPAGALELAPRRIVGVADLAELVAEHCIDEIVDLAGLPTLALIEMAAHLGVHTLSTSLEREADDGTPTLIGARCLLPGQRASVRGRHVVGAGMNPGLVNALVPLAQAELQRACPRGRVAGLYVTEEDSTEGPVPEGHFAMTWSPSACLVELTEHRASYVRAGTIVELEHAPWQAHYRVRCGARSIEGMVVPHEEIATLAARHPHVELAFVYRLPAAARRYMQGRRLLDPPLPRLDPQREPSVRLCPSERPVHGRDRVGVLAAAQPRGEVWVGWDTDVEAGLVHGCNATALQVAAGVVAGWQHAGPARGIVTVEDLDGEALLRTASSILGAPQVIHDPLAPWRRLALRRVPEPSADAHAGEATASTDPTPPSA